MIYLTYVMTKILKLKTLIIYMVIFRMKNIFINLNLEKELVLPQEYHKIKLKIYILK